MRFFSCLSNKLTSHTSAACWATGFGDSRADVVAGNVDGNMGIGNFIDFPQKIFFTRSDNYTIENFFGTRPYILPVHAYRFIRTCSVSEEFTSDLGSSPFGASTIASPLRAELT